MSEESVLERLTQRGDYPLVSISVKLIVDGYDVMITIKGDDPKEVVDTYEDTTTYFEEQHKVGMSQPPAAVSAPAPALAPAPAPAPAPATPAAPPPAAHAAPAGTQPPDDYEVIEVRSVTHVVSDNGNHSLKIKGGKYSKFGVTAWEEVVPAEHANWMSWDIGKEFLPYDDMKFAVVRDGKKVIAFRSTAQ